ncbi:MAG: PAS domain S-box protein [Thioploca sp.]|nr:PAS domain S-box protein [Thioploca sp.]
MSQWQAAINHNQIFKSQHRFKHPNGNVIWVTAQAVAERSADSEIMGYVGTLTDISETKQTEAQLTRYRNHLEEMVVQRANQLTQANQQLQQKIEERQQIEIALRESEARFASILNIAPEAIITVDQTQQIILFNQGAEHLFGYTSNQIMGMSLDTLVPSRLQAKHHQYFTEFNYEPITVRYLDESLGIFGKRQDGSEFPIEGSVSKLAQQKGTLFIVILRNAAKRWQSEQVLRENEEFYLLMMGGGKVGIWDWHISHDHLYISPHFKTLLGLNEPEANLQMADWFKQVYPEDLDRLKITIEHYLQGIISYYEIEYRVQDQTGHIHWILMRGHSLRDQNGKPYRLTGTNTDITELKQIADTLQETEQKYHLLLNRAKEAILILDNQGNVLEANRPAEMLFGYQRDELLQSNIFSLHAANQVEDLKDSCLQDSFTTGTCCLYETPILTKSGQTILVDIYGSIIECGEQKRLLTIIRDIRSRQQVQITLEKERTLLTQQLEQQTIPLKVVNDKLLTTISRELYSPLKVILTCCEALQQQQLGQLNSEQLHHLNDIYNHSHHLLKFVQYKLNSYQTPVSIAEKNNPPEIS